MSGFVIVGLEKGWCLMDGDGSCCGPPPKVLEILIGDPFIQGLGWLKFE